MYHEKTIKKENGDKVRIIVNFYLNHVTPKYSVTLYLCEKGKRKFHEIKFDDWDYRSLSMEARWEYRNKKHLEILTAEQILEVKKELWYKLAPNA